MHCPDHTELLVKPTEKSTAPPGSYKITNCTYRDATPEELASVGFPNHRTIWTPADIPALQSEQERRLLWHGIAVAAAFGLAIWVAVIELLVRL
jgi:hypothetical protein